jgi:MFS family permease
VLICGLSFLAFGFGAAGMTDHPILFFILLGVTGLGYGFTPPSLYAVMSDLLPPAAGSAPASYRSPTASAAPVGAVLASGSSPPSAGERLS